jgi:hypothetical protein
MTTLLLNQQVQDEIIRLSKVSQVDTTILEQFACFIIENSLPQSKKIVVFNIHNLKQAVYKRFNVNNTKELKNSGAFKMATDGMEKLDFRREATWEMLYRKFIDILPGEENQQGYGCINGINIFNYFKPWQVFGLDPKTATKEEIKAAYYRLSKIYHPDNPETGDRAIFERIEIMYKSITARI